MKRGKILLIILTLTMLLSMPSFSVSVLLPKPSYDFYVYDEVGILDNHSKNYIIEVNNELYKKTGAQVVVAITNNLENLDINTYATELFEEWKIGGKQYDNGLLMLIVPDNREIWIEVGYGLEGPLPDGRIKRIIEDKIIPSFRDQNYSNGIISGFEEILDYIENEYEISLESRASLNGSYINENYSGITSGFDIPSIFPVIGIIIFLFIDFRFFHGWLTFSLLRGLGRGGRGGFGGGSGRGGSRGGGGRSGGGGAGGRW